MPQEATRVSWRELQDAFDYVSFGEPGENQAVLCRPSGKLFFHSENLGDDDQDEWPDDVDDNETYVGIPHKKELDLGKPLVFAFVEEALPDEFGEVERIFSRRGGYARFKDLLHRKHALDQWYKFEAAASDRALREWCEFNEITIDETIAATDS